jgi:hypothetical protein
MKGYERCGTMPTSKMLKISDPGLEGRMAEMEKLTGSVDRHQG